MYKFDVQLNSKIEITRELVFEEQSESFACAKTTKYNSIKNLQEKHILSFFCAPSCMLQN